MANDITQEEWQEKIANDPEAVILDVRSQEELDDGGYIPGTKHIDIRKGKEFVEEVKKLDTSKHYYVYCRSGARSGKACDIMEQLGFDITYNLLGGFMEWEGAIEE